MTEKEKYMDLLKQAFSSPKRGMLFSEMLTYWCCVISAEGGKPVCIEGNNGNLAIRKYESAEELEKRYRYSGIEGYWVFLHDISESNAKKFEEAFISQREEKGEKRDAIIEMLTIGR